MEWSHTHFDGYELLAVPADSPPSLLLLDSSALVLVQRVLLPKGDLAPRALTWQPGGARTGCSSGALSCIVSARGGPPELAVFTPNGVHLSCRVRYSWSCAARVPLSPLHRGIGGRLLLAWSCRGPLVVADQALSIWSNSCSVPGDTCDSLSSGGEGSSASDGDAESASDNSDDGQEPRKSPGLAGGRRSRSLYRNSVRLDRKWVRKSIDGQTNKNAPFFTALTTSPCGCMFAAACEGASQVIVWLRRSNLPSRHRHEWNNDKGEPGRLGKPHKTSLRAAVNVKSWDFQPATVLAHDGALAQVAWGRGPGNQQDYLLTLQEDGSARVWVEQAWPERDSQASENGTLKFLQAATIKSWYGDVLRLQSVGFVKWAYFGSHGKDLVLDQGTAPGSAYHLVHKQEQEAEGGTRPVRSDNCVIGCDQDGRLFLWSLQDMPLPDGRTTPGLLEVASLPYKWLADSAALTPSPGSPWVLSRVSAVGYYDAQGAGGAPTELQAVARAAGGTLAVITARLHHDGAKGKFAFRNTRSVVLPLGLRGSTLARLENGDQVRASQAVGGMLASATGRATGALTAASVASDGVPHPNLPLIARLRKGGSCAGDSRSDDGWRVEVHSWVNGGSHLQCIPCKPRGHRRGQPGHTAGAEPGHTEDGGEDSVGWLGGGSVGNGGVELGSVAPLFGELASKVKSGDELSFVPYALPSLTVYGFSCGSGSHGRSDFKSNDDSEGNACDRESGWGEGRIEHTMWLADWIGAEALPPALMVIDSNSRLHIFELDDGAAEEEAPGDRFDVANGMPSAEMGIRRSSLGALSNMSSTGSFAGILSHSIRTMDIKGDGGNSPGVVRDSGSERTSRRAQAETSARLVVEDDVTPCEKTVVLPLDATYGLGLTLAFRDNQVEVATFVRHPDTGEMLPAEASGRIRPGDELVDINGNNVEGMNGDDATALIRKARRKSMEGGAVTLELTFREAAREPGSALPRSSSGSPKPRTGWYSSSRRARGRAPCAAPAEEWPSTDADRQALRWHPVGTADIPTFQTCTLLPWIHDGAGGSEDGANLEAQQMNQDGNMNSPGITDAPWIELGVYPLGDGRKRRRALLLGFQAAGTSGSTTGYVVALLVEAGARGGVLATELCRAPLESGHEPMTFNGEKTPPGAPTSSRAATEAICADGWIRRWCLTSPTSTSGYKEHQGVMGDLHRDEKKSCFALRRVDLCRPFRDDFAGRQPPTITAPAAATTTEVMPGVVLIAVASPHLLAIARMSRRAEDAEGTVVSESSPIVEVWSCSTAPYPRSRFRRDGPVVFSGFRDVTTVEGMCWVSPEAGDERGGAVSGHCLCVSMGGTVTVFARERRELPPAGPGLIVAAVPDYADSEDKSERMWSPVFRVTNPCSLLTCRAAGLRDFCQGLMAKYQRNLALSLVRSRRPGPLGPKNATSTAQSPEEATTIETQASPPPLPLSRDELDGLRGGTTREGRRLEDWHPESLAAMWCTSLVTPGEDKSAAWRRGRERTLSILRWVSAEAAAEPCGGVIAGTVVPILAHRKSGNVESVEYSEGGDDVLRALSTILAEYVRGSDIYEERRDGGRKGSGTVAPSDPNTATAVAPRPLRLPRRLQILSPSELAAVAAILDEALGVDGALPPASAQRPASAAGARDTAASLFARDSSQETPAPKPSPIPVPPIGGFANIGLSTGPQVEGDDCANVFLLARGLRARLVGSGTGIGSLDASTSVASSAALAMLLSSTAIQTDVLEKLCPKDSAGGLGGAAAGAGDVTQGLGLTWGEARALMIPLWVRDVKELQRVTTALAANTYRHDRNLMAAALFYVVLGNDKKLLALAKADSGFLMQKKLSGAEGSIHTTSGKAAGATPGQRLEKLLSHDFSSPRGREVAGKNAFILLRKRDYTAAAAVFLLARPAMLKEALHVLLLHVKDLQLCLVVARLIEVRDGTSASPAPAGRSGFGGGFGGGGGLLGRGGGSFGGGGRFGDGFVGGFGSNGGGRIGELAPDAGAAYASLGGACRKLLREEFLPKHDGEHDVPTTGRRQTSGMSGSQSKATASASSLEADPCYRNSFLEAASLFWLGQSDRALRALCRGQATETDVFNGMSMSTGSLPGTPKPNGNGHGLQASGGGDGSGVGAAGLAMCNRAIDVATRPLLVTKLKLAHRQSSRKSAAGFGSTSRALGVAMSASSQAPGQSTVGKGVRSGIVDAPNNALRAATARLTTAEYLARNGMEISALEVLGSAAGGKWATELAEEIADEVSREPQGATTKAVGILGGFSGGALGGFGGRPGSTAGAGNGEISDGGIFGDFDGPPCGRPSIKAAPAASQQLASGELSGDLFGGFDGPPRPRPVKKAPAADSMASGELSGDLFGSFDGPPRPKRPAATAAPKLDPMPSGELSGDMFGGFDGPPRPPVAPRSSAVTSMANSPTSLNPSPAVAGSERAKIAFHSYGYRDGEEPTWRGYDEYVEKRLSETSNGEGDDDEKEGGGRCDHSAKASLTNDDDKDPENWASWAQELAYEAAMTRLLRELRYLLGGLDALAPTAPNMAFALESLGAASSLKSRTSGSASSTAEIKPALLEGVRATAVTLCEAHGLSTKALTEAAAGALCHTSAGGSRRLGALCVLLHALDRPVAADAAVCAAAGRLLQCCSVHGRAHLEDLSLRAAQAKALSAQVAESAEAAAKEETKTAVAPAPATDIITSPPEERPATKARSPISYSLSRATAATKGLVSQVEEAATPTAVNVLGLENLRPHLSELRSAAFQLELCLSLHARGCLRLSARARAEAAVGFRAGLLVEALGRRYDITATLVEYPPAPLSLDELVLAGCEEEQVPTSPLTDTTQPLHGSGSSPSAYPRFLEAHHRLNEIPQSPPTANSGFGDNDPHPEPLVDIASHPAYCREFTREDADAVLKDLARGTFLLRPARGGGGAQGSKSGGHRNGTKNEQKGLDRDTVVMSVAVGGTSSCADDVRHLIFRAIEADSVDDANEGEEEVREGVSCGLVGPERTVNDLLLRIRKLGLEENTVQGPNAGLDTPNASLLDALSRLYKPEFEALGLEPWESSLRGTPASSEDCQNETSAAESAPAEQTPPNPTREQNTDASAAGAGAGESITTSRCSSTVLDDERLCIVRLVDCLSRGVWPTYARLACALNLLSLRAMHAHLCNWLADLLRRRDFRARAPLTARVCGAVPFLPAGGGGQAFCTGGINTLPSTPESALGRGFGTTEEASGMRGAGSAGAGGGLSAAATSSSSSSMFYSAFLHPLYVWAQCLDRQFYAQAHRPTIAPAHHLIPRRRGRLVSNTTLLARATGAEIPALTPTAEGGAEETAAGVGASFEFSIMSPTLPERECCPYLFQRGMVVSEEGVRGGLDHLRCDQTWPEEDSEERVAYQALNGIRSADGSIIPSVPLQVVKEVSAAGTHYVEAFYSSDARSWLNRAGIDPAGPASGARLRRWEKLGIVQRVQMLGPSGHLHFRGERHKGDLLLRFVDRWEVEQCGDASGGALRAGPLGRMLYLPVPVGRLGAGRDTLYGRLLYAIGGSAAIEMWTRLGAEDWLVKTISRAEFPFSHRHQLADFSAGSGGRSSSGVAPLNPAAAAAAASDMPCPLHSGGRRQEQNSFFLCVFEHLCRNSLFRRLRLPHRFQALVSVQLLGLKNLSPHFHPSKTDVYAAVSLQRPDQSSFTGAVSRNHSDSHLHAEARRRGRNTSMTAVKRLLPTANGQASQQSRWGAKVAFRFALPEEASPYLLAYGDRAYGLVMGGYETEDSVGGGGGGIGVESLGPPKCVGITVWKKMFVSDQRLGEVEVPLNTLDDRGVADEWVALRGDKGSSWFVNVRFSLRFVMVSVSDPNPAGDDEVDQCQSPESPMSLSHALADVDMI